ncbi:MAG: hypothetical protein II794_00780 [Oscillospiraceae bacterium]|nr:hypothetical protein [Oscillospiraceae bacterium]
MAPILRKLKSRSGISRLTAILAVAVIILAVMSTYPFWKQFVFDATGSGCFTSRQTCIRDIKIAYASGLEVTEESVRAMMYKHNTTCPDGGDLYIIEDAEGRLTIVCGIHDHNDKERVTLNSARALKELQRAVLAAQQYGTPFPEKVTVTVNSIDYTALLVDEDPGLVRGTASTKGYEGTVILFSIVGHSDFGKNSGLEEGQVWFMTYAEPEECATWTYGTGWTGSAILG